ncbi:UDP-glycosyltransferase 73C6-like [Momordica charantia]|uniref:Glycosyltransferase n=1 Tax=Momordica charantia TaxID=3673 RepID=A0A6J1CTQ2_MOMCH|nr:UDP-glycosyltransferase 73C6-like [Momordica charantia]
MASENAAAAAPHFLLLPIMAQGHLIPMADFAKLLAEQGVKVTLVTTPQNAPRFQSLLSKPALQIQIQTISFPPENGIQCENFDSLPSLELGAKFFADTSLLRGPTEELFQRLSPRPSCLVSDMALPWTGGIARKFNVPRLVFYSLSCFYLRVITTLRTTTDVVYKIMAAADLEPVTIPDLPDPVQITKAKLIFSLDPIFMDWSAQMAKADHESYGFVLNSFQDLEPKYLSEFKKVTGSKKVWCVGPVSLCNKDTMDKTHRGDKSAIGERECLEWLDKQDPSSVIYAALGSTCNVATSQMIELGLALQASNRPFIWVIRQTNATQGLEKWLSEHNFEDKANGRGLVVRGWAPQVLILSHPAIGAFVTHCGWNSTIEAIATGVPMVAWPLFADQMFNEMLIVQILKIGASVGVEKCYAWGAEEEIGVQVKKEAVIDAIEKVMDGEDKEGMRRRVREFAERAKAATEDGGSSHLNVKLLIKDIMDQGHSGPNKI